MSNVNSYYLGSLEHIFGSKLSKGLVSLIEAQELCAKKYIRNTNNEDALAAPLTQQELARVWEKFPDIATAPMPPCALSPMVRRVSDPDGVIC